MDNLIEEIDEVRRNFSDDSFAKLDEKIASKLNSGEITILELLDDDAIFKIYMKVLFEDDFEKIDRERYSVVDEFKILCRIKFKDYEETRTFKAEYLVRLNTLKENFDLEKYEAIDKELSSYIGTWKVDIQEELEERIAEEFGDKDYVSSKNTILNLFISIGEDNDYYFENTRLFASCIKEMVYKKEKLNTKIDICKYIKLYLNKVEKNKLCVINDNLSMLLFNSARIKRIPDYGKVKKLYSKYICNEYKEVDVEERIKEYDDVIKERITLNKRELDKFLLLINDIKLKKGLIPRDVCEYLFSEMLNPKSAIAKYKKEYRGIRGCILCDYGVYIQRDNKVKDHLILVDRFEGKLNGDCNNYRIRIQSFLIDEFTKNNIEAFYTLIHEITHSIQKMKIKNKDYLDFMIYSMVKEKVVNKELKENYYWYKANEINARRNSYLLGNKILKDINIDVDKLKTYIYNDKNEKEIVSIPEYVKIKEKSYYSTLIERKLNLGHQILEIVEKKIKSDPFCLEKTPILYYEYYIIGEKKMMIDMLKKLEEDYVKKEIKKADLLAVLSTTYVERNNDLHSLVESVLSFEYTDEKFKKICIDTLLKELTEIRVELKYKDSKSKRIELRKAYDKEINIINKYIKENMK